MFFPLGLYSIWSINYVFSFRAMFKHWTWFKFVSIIFHILHAYLKATTERCSQKCAFFKTQETRRLNKHNDSEGQRHDLSDVKLLLITCIKNTLSFIALTLSQFDAEIYGDNFNAFSLKALERIFPEFVKDSNLPSLYNWCFQIVAYIKSLNQS